MNEKTEGFIPENMQEEARLKALVEFHKEHAARRRAGGGRFDGLARFVKLFVYAVLLLCLGVLLVNGFGAGVGAAWLACVVVGFVVIDSRNLETLNILWPALLGPVGIIPLFASRTRKLWKTRLWSGIDRWRFCAFRRRYWPSCAVPRARALVLADERLLNACSASAAAPPRGDCMNAA